MPDRVLVQVGSQVVTLSHLDKLLWPRFSKGEALHYYAQVAAVLLPHTAGRPASFVRFPDGVGGPRFYGKNPPPGLADWVSTAQVPHKEGPKPHVVLNTLGDLMAMGNLYGLEIHVPQWTSAAGPQAHDRLVIDLDPGEGAGITECCQVALLARELLAADGLQAWAKTSGSKGLHLYAPISAATGDETAGYAKKLAQRLEAEHPDLVVHKMAKALRSGRVFVDWSQNTTAKTTAAPYTLRATDTPVPASPPPSPGTRSPPPTPTPSHSPQTRSWPGSASTAISWPACSAPAPGRCSRSTSRSDCAAAVPARAAEQPPPDAGGMSDSAQVSFYVRKVPSRFAAVVVETADEHGCVFAESPVVTWSDLDGLAQQYGVPGDRIFIDDAARAVLDAA